jgi:putative tryptophan/tyrosine transport system substrate-binding protein
MRRREFVLALGGTAACAALLWPRGARAQQRAMPVVGVLGSGSAAAYSERLALIGRALAESGFTEGTTVATEYRWAEGQLERLPHLASDLVARNVNVIVATGGLQASRAAVTATSTVPIVFSTDGDPVKQGLVASLNRPGGNATGITVFSGELTPKRLEIFREVVPKTRTFAVLVNALAPQASEQIRDAEESARARGLEVRVLNVKSEADFEPTIALLAGSPGAALLISADPLFVARRETLVAAANRHALPAIYGRRDFAVAGGLISYGANVADLYYLMGIYVARILKGEKPANLPVAQPTRFELTINLRTARTLGLDIPAKLLALADEVIE